MILQSTEVLYRLYSATASLCWKSSQNLSHAYVATVHFSKLLHFGFPTIKQLVHHTACSCLPTVGFQLFHVLAFAMLESGNSSSCGWCAPPPAGLPLECKMQYLLSVLSTRRHDHSSLLRAAFANVTLASFCLAVSIATTFAARCCSPFPLKKHVMALALIFQGQQLAGFLLL